jgi:hypothetical protein
MVMTEEEKKESKKASDKKYMEKNKEKIKAKQKDYMKAYRDKPENKARKKAYNEKQEKKKAKQKANRDKSENKAKIKANSQTPEGIKYCKISGWKKGKIISNDWDATFDWVMNTKNCEKCDVLLESGTGKNGKCLDHDHTITDGPNARAVLCMDCNKNEGKKRHASKEERDKYYKEQIKCDCGTTTSRINMNAHKKSAKHINFHIN